MRSILYRNINYLYNNLFKKGTPIAKTSKNFL